MARCLLHWSCSEWKPTETFSGLTLLETASSLRYLMTAPAQRPMLKRPQMLLPTARLSITKLWWTTTTTIIVWAKYELGFHRTKDIVIVSLPLKNLYLPHDITEIVLCLKLDFVRNDPNVKNLNFLHVWKLQSPSQCIKKHCLFPSPTAAYKRLKFPGFPPGWALSSEQGCWVFECLFLLSLQL